MNEKTKELLYEKITKRLAGRTFLHTPFFRIKAEGARKNRKWEPSISWLHWHADWHLIGIRVRLFRGEYDISWVSDPSYFLNRSRWRL